MAALFAEYARSLDCKMANNSWKVLFIEKLLWLQQNLLTIVNCFVQAYFLAPQNHLNEKLETNSVVVMNCALKFTMFTRLC